MTDVVTKMCSNYMFLAIRSNYNSIGTNLAFTLYSKGEIYLKGLHMKAKIRGVITLALITLGSIGCSSSPTVYYAGNFYV